jgi:hypothetical protein
MKQGLYTLRAYTIAAVTLLLGIIVSINVNEWSWFARSGALVVVNGILLTSHHIIIHMHSLNRYHQQRLCNRDWAQDEKYEFIQDDNEHRWMSEKHGLYMLIGGTLIWAFGDLFNLL